MSLKRSVFGITHPAHKLALFLLDISLLAICFYAATQYRLKVSPDFFSLEFIGLNVIILSSLFVGGAYTSNNIASRPKLPLNTFFTVIAATLPSLLFIYLLGPERFTALLGRGVFPFAIVSFGVCAVVQRYVVNHIFHDANVTKTILLLGNEKAVDRVKRSFSGGQINIDFEHAGKLCEVQHAAHRLSAIVITPNYVPTEEEQQSLIHYRLSGTPIFSLTDFFESFLFLVPVQEINDNWFIRAQGFTMLHSSVALRLKRAVDIFTAIILIATTLPIIGLSALLIKLTSKGPIFFSQTRVGIQGKPFTLYKFRTMNIDAEQDGAQWASDNDPRVFSAGNFLRKTRIDELPQCWNILKGEMSIIGPRPERPEFTSMLSKEIPYYDLRHVVKPGLTGWAQVSYPYGASTEDSLRKLQFDLYYIKNYSLLLDLNILLRTVLVTVGRGGR